MFFPETAPARFPPVVGLDPPPFPSLIVSYSGLDKALQDGLAVALKPHVPLVGYTKTKLHDMSTEDLESLVKHSCMKTAKHRIETTLRVFDIEINERESMLLAQWDKERVKAQLFRDHLVTVKKTIEPYVFEMRDYVHKLLESRKSIQAKIETVHIVDPEAPLAPILERGCDVLEVVFSYLSFADLAGNVAVACRAFWTFARTRVYATIRIVDTGCVHPDTYWEYMSHFKVRRLHVVSKVSASVLGMRERTPADLSRILLKAREFFRIGDIQSLDVSGTISTKFLQHYHSLEHLRLFGTVPPLGPSQLRTLSISSLGDLPKGLVHLTFRVKSYATLDLVCMSSMLTSLRSFSICLSRHVYMPRKWACIRALMALPNLRTLNIRGIGVTPILDEDVIAWLVRLQRVRLSFRLTTDHTRRFLYWLAHAMSMISDGVVRRLRVFCHKPIEWDILQALISCSDSGRVIDTGFAGVILPGLVRVAVEFPPQRESLAREWILRVRSPAARIMLGLNDVARITVYTTICSLEDIFNDLRSTHCKVLFLTIVDPILKWVVPYPSLRYLSISNIALSTADATPRLLRILSDHPHLETLVYTDEMRQVWLTNSSVAPAPKVRRRE